MPTTLNASSIGTDKFIFENDQANFISIFHEQNPQDIVCIIIIKSGTLNMFGCILSMESI